MIKETKEKHWTKQREVAKSYLPFRLMVAMVRRFPLWFLRLWAFPISFFYYLLNPQARRESRYFFNQLGKNLSTYKHVASFAFYLVEKAAAWAGKIDQDMVQYYDDDIHALVDDIRQKRGAMLFCSHLGNAEMLRALADLGRTAADQVVPVISIVDFAVTENFNHMLREINPGSHTRLISARDIGVETMERLETCLAAGGLVAIAADRTGTNDGRRYTFDFLGRPAPFPMGPFYIAALLNTRVYFCYGLRQKTLALNAKYDMFVSRCDIDFTCSRNERKERMAELARRYVASLESQCRERPYQWYNFYDFWERGDAS